MSMFHTRRDESPRYCGTGGSLRNPLGERNRPSASARGADRPQRPDEADARHEG